MKRGITGSLAVVALTGVSVFAAPADSWAASTASCTTSVNYKTVRFTCSAPAEARKVEVKLECWAGPVPVAGSEEVIVSAGSGRWQEMFCPEGTAVGDYGWWDRGAA
ncbi:hypothetical protein ACMYYO_15040 [Dermacoccaceae bacterium W4C1]